MAPKQPWSNRPTMKHCEYCGEDYASTYKHCPFCDEVPMDPEASVEDGSYTPRKGRRLATNTRGGGYGRGPSPLRMLGIVVPLASIIAAVSIAISVIIPLVTEGGSVDDPGAVESIQPAESVTPTGGGETEPSPTPTETIPADQTATGFSLNYTEFSISNRYPDPVTLTVTFIPAGSTGTITWTSSDPEVVSVDENGTVSPGSKTGSATITATMAGGVTQTCLVRNSVTSSGGSTTEPSQSPSGGGTASATLSLNRTDFTLSSAYPSYQVKVSGTSSTPTWSIANTGVATVSADGTVTYVSRGQTTLTCTVDGQTLTCIVRCS